MKMLLNSVPSFYIQISELILNVKAYFQEDNTRQDQSPTSLYDEEEGSLNSIIVSKSQS